MSRTQGAEAFLRRDPAEGDRRILVVIPDYRDGEVGAMGALMRNAALVSGLRQAAPVDVFAVSAAADVSGCARRCDACSSATVATALGPQPVPHNFFRCDRALAELGRFLRRRDYSAVLVSHLCMSAYVTAVRAHTTAPLVVDFHNAEADLVDEMAAHGAVPRGEQAATAAVEARLLEEADVVTVPSSQDRARILSRYSTATPLVVVPNAVAVDPRSRPVTARRPVLCYFLGALDYYPNVRAAEQVFRVIGPAVSALAPHLRVVVAGRRPSAELAELAATGPVELLADPPDVRPLLRDSALLVPLDVGGGSRLKIMEAFAAGTSVISTAKGIEGIEAVPGQHYLPAHESPDFIAAVAQLLADPEADLRRRQAAWELARDRYSWEAVASPLVTALTEAGW